MIQYLILILVGNFATLLTYTLQVKYKQGGVRSSALPTLIIAGLLHVFPNELNSYFQVHIPIVFIGCTFIGMISSKQLSTYTGLSLASFIFCLLYFNTSIFFAGYGGALGTSACIALLIILSIPHFQNKRKLTIGLLQLRKFVLKKASK